MSITLLPAANITFMLNSKDGSDTRTVNIPDYYKQFYGTEVTRPRLPCVQVS